MASDWSFYGERWDVVVLDPPRTGAEAPVAELDRAARAASSTCRVTRRRWPATRRCSSRTHGFTLRRPASSTCFRTRITSKRSRCSRATDTEIAAIIAPMPREIERKFLLEERRMARAGDGKAADESGLSRERRPRRRCACASPGTRRGSTSKRAASSRRARSTSIRFPLDEARELLALAEGPLIEKTRHFVEHGGMTWEIDEFHGENAGLVVAELELESEDAAVSAAAVARRRGHGAAALLQRLPRHASLSRMDRSRTEPVSLRVSLAAQTLDARCAADAR